MESDTPRDATTLADTMRALDARGYRGQFRVTDERAIQCLTCRRASAPGAFEIEYLERLEGASDPADMVAVAALRCPECGAAGTLTVHYGPEMVLEEADVLRALEDGRVGTGVTEGFDG
jgi:hypothetical protein